MSNGLPLSDLLEARSEAEQIISALDRAIEDLDYRIKEVTRQRDRAWAQADAATIRQDMDGRDRHLARWKQRKEQRKKYLAKRNQKMKLRDQAERAKKRQPTSSRLSSEEL